MNGELTHERFADFDRLLADSEAARQVYVQYIYETLALPLMLAMGEEEHVLPSFTEIESTTMAPPMLSSATTTTSGGPQETAARQPKPAASLLPLHHPPWHARLFLLGLAGGVSGGNGDYRDRAGDWRHDACVQSGQVARAIHLSPLSSLPSSLQWSAGSPAWSTVSGLRAQGPGTEL